MKINRSISVIICLLLSMSLTSCGQEYTFHFDWANGFFSFNDEDEVPEFGNSPSVALEPEEYLPGDQLYDEGHPNYLKEGTPYMTAEIQKGLKDLWDNHPALPVMIEKLDFPENAVSFENLVEEDPQTGRREFSTEAILLSDYFTIVNHPDDNGNVDNREIYKKLSPEERMHFFDLEKKFISLYSQFLNRNLAKRSKDGLSVEEVLNLFK